MIEQLVGLNCCSAYQCVQYTQKKLIGLGAFGRTSDTRKRVPTIEIDSEKFGLEVMTGRDSLL